MLNWELLFLGFVLSPPGIDQVLHLESVLLIDYRLFLSYLAFVVCKCLFLFGHLTLLVIDFSISHF